MTDLATLTDELRAYLVGQGASPCTAHSLAVVMAEKAHAAIERDQLERQAQMLLPLGAAVAAERLRVCRATVYNLVHRARAKSKQFAAG